MIKKNLMKLSITLSPDIVDELDRIGEKTGLKRSFLIRKCCEFCIKDRRCWSDLFEGLKKEKE
jgi:metal-responsive CopG/Arc/MetJ family transcriptional regulator